MLESREARPNDFWLLFVNKLGCAPGFVGFPAKAFAKLLALLWLKSIEASLLMSDPEIFIFAL